MAQATTVTPYDLDAAEDVIQPTAGWHTANLVGFEVNPNKAGTGTNMVFSFELAEDDPDRPGMPWTYYIPLPTEVSVEDYKKWVAKGKPKSSEWDPEMLTKDGRHKYAAAMQRCKKISAAFGSAESGAFDPAKFGRFIGKKVKIELVPEREQGGGFTGRMTIGFDGVAPA